MSCGGPLSRLKRVFEHKYDKPPYFFWARSHTLFIISTVGVGIFSDLFLYGLVVPILPFLLVDRTGLPEEQVQAHTSGLLAAYAAAAVVFSPVAGAISDKTSSRQMPFLAGLSSLIFATALLFSGASVPVLALARVLQGASSAFVWTVGLALCVDTVGPSRLGTVVGSIFAVVSVGVLFSPVVGGALYEKAGIGAVAAVAIAILVVDFAMRLLVIEKKVAKRYIDRDPKLAPDSARDGPVDHTHAQDSRQDVDDEAANGHGPSETDALLPNGKDHERDYYRIPDDQPALIRHAPILYCLSAPSLLLALVVALVQATLFSAFDATIPTHAKDLYGFDSLTASLLFAPLGVCDVIVGPIAGWITDNYGTKVTGVFGYAYLVPALSLLRIPVSHPVPQQPILYGGILALCGVGMATIGPPSIVEAGSVVEKYHKYNPELFGESGPYAQLYGMNSLVFNLGLAIGPVLAGALKDSIGYGDMNAVLAALSAMTAVACYIWLGGKPKPWMGRPGSSSRR